MLGHRRTVPLWQQKRINPFAIERSLAQRQLPGTDPKSFEKTVIGKKSARRMLLAAKYRARLTDG